MTFTAKFGHDDNCTPGIMTFDATTIDQAIEQANQFVESGVRNSTWINVDLENSAYAARNVHGKAVGEITTY